MRTGLTRAKHFTVPSLRPPALLIFGAAVLLLVKVSGQGGRKALDEPERRAREQRIICEREYINFAFGRRRL